MVSLCPCVMLEQLPEACRLCNPTQEPSTAYYCAPACLLAAPMITNWAKERTPARKDYIHKCLLLEWISRTKIHFSYKKYFRELISRKLHSRIRLWLRELHGKCIWELFSWKISSQLHEIMFSKLISQSFLAGVYLLHKGRWRGEKS